VVGTAGSALAFTGRALAGPHAKRRVAALAIVLLALGGGWLWLRDSGLVSVDRVTITGVSGPEARAIRSALRDAGTNMTTLHVDEGALRDAVRAFPLVRDVRVSTDFPHGLRIRVVEHRPVAAVTIDGARVPVAGDGTLLRGQPATASLPTLPVPAANAGGRLTARQALTAVAIVAAAPPGLRATVTSVDQGVDSLKISLANGPTVDFGDATRPRAKWAAIAAVLGDQRSQGASYLDVRVPERPVAGRFLGAGISDTQPQVQVDTIPHP
jgi:cell division protein FtsQ